jgi:hypothetical protein
MQNLLTEFRRELMRSINKISDDDFRSKDEVADLINKAYARAKQRCADDEVSLEDE